MSHIYMQLLLSAYVLQIRYLCLPTISRKLPMVLSSAKPAHFIHPGVLGELQMERCFKPSLLTWLLGKAHRKRNCAGKLEAPAARTPRHGMFSAILNYRILTLFKIKFSELQSGKPKAKQLSVAPDVPFHGKQVLSFNLLAGKWLKHYSANAIYPDGA